MPTTQQVPSVGVTLAVREHTPAAPDRPTVVLVHGYPDRQQMWDLVVAALPGEQLHVVTYDVRGAGASGVPTSTAGYRTHLLVEDLAAVLDAVLPVEGRAHLVGHDWGSVQLWDAVAAASTHPRLRDRIASFTSISGPSLDHMSWVLRHPGGRRRKVARQLMRSWYVAAFSVPVLPDLAWTHLAGPLRRLLADRERLGGGHWGPGLAADARNGLGLYRANVPRRPRGGLPTDVPVLVIRPRYDAYLTEVLLEDLDRVATDIRVVELAAGHWVPRTHPDEVAGLVVEHVRASS